jgi:hypothetical protein
MPVVVVLFKQNNNQNCNLLTLNENQNLDIYLPKSEINTHINQLQDLGQLREIRDKSKMIMTASVISLI